jgi:hypothetical protein
MSITIDSLLVQVFDLSFMDAGIAATLCIVNGIGMKLNEHRKYRLRYMVNDS